MARMRNLRLVSCESGTTAVEFALLLPPFLMLFLGILSACVVIFAAANLHYAVEGAARVYSISGSAVNPNQCGSAATAQSYAQNHYLGPSSPTFAASNPSCGCQVKAALTLVLNAGPANWTIPLSAAAWFPLTY